MVFEYVSGEGTDANSRQAWARVKAETETALSKWDSAMFMPCGPV